MLASAERKYVGSLEGTNVPKQEKSLPPGIDKKQSHLYNQKDNAMDNRSYIKWYAERLHELLLQYPNDPIIADLCVALERFLHTVGIDSLQAELPPGVSVDGE